eukprot:TRINITY_DN1045_c0_g3_i3.p1 TRINITY_DN1045_c0_g3~~TRINITY_DN1045_c0_g3_i3.p1  ORF type:complete len:124 (+),score=4.26 TRINITY_DN1045_c0_g3_i3:47-418(+)
MTFPPKPRIELVDPPILRILPPPQAIFYYLVNHYFLDFPPNSTSNVTDEPFPPNPLPEHIDPHLLRILPAKTSRRLTLPQTNSPSKSGGGKIKPIHSYATSPPLRPDLRTTTIAAVTRATSSV